MTHLREDVLWFLFFLLAITTTKGKNLHDVTRSEKAITEKDMVGQLTEENEYIEKSGEETYTVDGEDCFTNTEKVTDHNYLDVMFPSNKEIMHEEETPSEMRGDVQKLMWLRAEGERLVRENKKFAKRLKELKSHKIKPHHHKKVKTEDEDLDDQVLSESKRKELEKIQQALEEQLEDMNTSIQKSIVEHLQIVHERENAPIQRQKKEKNKAVKKSTKKLSHWKSTAELVDRLTEEISTVSSKEALSSNLNTIAKSVSAKFSSTSPISRHTSHKRKIKKKKVKMSRSTLTHEVEESHYSTLKTTESMTDQIRERSFPTSSEPKIPSGIFMDEAGTKLDKIETPGLVTTTSKED